MIITKLNIQKDQLWQGCILASIAHAIMLCKFPELDYEHSWDGNNYSTNNGSGCRATITFDQKYTIAVFQDSSLKINNKNVKKYLDISNKELMNIAESEALQYVLEDVEGFIKPCISAAFWGIDNILYSFYDFKYLYEKGVYIISNQMSTFKKSLDYWEEYYDMNKSQMELANKIFDLRVNTEDCIILSKEDKSVLLSNGGKINEECIESFKELNIKLN